MFPNFKIQFAKPIEFKSSEFDLIVIDNLIYKWWEINVSYWAEKKIRIANFQNTKSFVVKKLMKTNADDSDRQLDLDQKYTVANDILFRQVEGEGILLHISSGTYYNLNETSIMFWQAIADSKPLIPVVEQIINEYEVERECVLEDLQIFLQDLSQNQIITPSAA